MNLTESLDWQTDAAKQANITWLALTLTKLATIPTIGEDFVSRAQNSSFLGVRPVHVRDPIFSV